MRITDIHLNNYRAFYGAHHIHLEKSGKNLMVYGENGSGKSSLFTALQNFFKASVGKVDVEENIFIPKSQKDTANIKITIRENALATTTQEFELDIINKEIIGANKILISDANKVKGFFDYRSLLETHLSHKDDVNIFKILINNILPHAENRFTKKEIGIEWKIILSEMKERKGMWRVDWLHKNTDSFSKGFKYLLDEIEKDVNNFIQYFDKSISVKIGFDEIGYDEDDKSLYGDEAILKIKFSGVDIPKHHLFLNEARLSALAISLYLASIKANPLTGTLKILVLDDLLIGLDMSNRLPLLLILKNHFVNVEPSQQFQVVMTTYDKVWFDLVTSYFGSDKWHYIEIYSKKLKDDDYEMPIIKNSLGYIDKARFYLAEKDNKAAAVYIRTEFERLISTLCEDKYLQVIYKTKKKDLSSEDFWTAIKEQTDIDTELIKEIETHRNTVMNPFSHFDLEKPEFERELTDTIATVEKLKVASIKKLKKEAVEVLQEKIEALEKDVASKQNTIKIMGEKFKEKKAE